MERLLVELLQARDSKEKALDNLIHIAKQSIISEKTFITTQESLKKMKLHQEELEIKAEQVESITRELDNQVQELQVDLKNKKGSLAIENRRTLDLNDTIKFKNSVIVNLCDELVQRVGSINNQEANLFYAMSSEYSTM